MNNFKLASLVVGTVSSCEYKGGSYQGPAALELWPSVGKVEELNHELEVDRVLWGRKATVNPVTWNLIMRS